MVEPSDLRSLTQRAHAFSEQHGDEAYRRVGLTRGIVTHVPNWGTPAGQLLEGLLRFPLGPKSALSRHICRTGYTRPERSGPAMIDGHARLASSLMPPLPPGRPVD